MATNSKIEWTDHTFNPWIGCTKVSSGCDNCYAEALMDNRLKRVEWGAQAERRRTSAAYWKQPFRWNNAAEAAGAPTLVFCASLADVFDPKAPNSALTDLWQLIRATPWLRWQLLTKRPRRIECSLPPDWGDGWDNVWLGITCENQGIYDRRWKILQEVPAVVRFISYEPALGSMRMNGGTHPDWLIWGGESGPRARPTMPDWVRAVVADCQENNIPVFGKQWGKYSHNPLVIEKSLDAREAKQHDPPDNGKGGALLDGILYRHFPHSFARNGQMGIYNDTAVTVRAKAKLTIMS